MLLGGKGGGEQLTFFTNHDGSLCPVWRGQFNLLMYCGMCSEVVMVCVCVCVGGVTLRTTHVASRRGVLRTQKLRRSMLRT